jgi:CHASE2 domain-containing sensor protein
VAVSLSARVVLRGALADLAVLVPLVLLYAVVGGITIVGAVAAALIGPLVGGAVAGRPVTAAPLTHGAAAAGVASIAYVIFRVLDAALRNRPVHAASLAFLVIVGVTCGLLGGWAGFRTRVPTP